MFLGDTFLFSKVYDINTSVSKLNADLEMINYWAYQWKIRFNPGSKKQSNEVIFSRKLSSNKLSYPPVKCNNNDIPKCLLQKHIVILIFFYSKLKFNAHLNQKNEICNKIISLSGRLSVRSVLKMLYLYNISLS